MPNRRTESPHYSPRDNYLLAALPAADYERILPHLELVPMPVGKVLYEAGLPLRHFYFPVAGVVSMLHVMNDGRTAEIAVLGRDGCVGIAHLLGGATTPNRKVVQIRGHAYRLPPAILMGEFHRGEALQDLLLRYVQAFMTQMAQTSVCNRHHRVEQQLCRWLLLCLDLIDGDELHMTQELISNMLGVRRTGITEAAGKLEEAGVIENRRGLIRVPDHAKLQEHACECYAAVKKEMRRLDLLPASSLSGQGRSRSSEAAA